MIKVETRDIFFFFFNEDEKSFFQNESEIVNARVIFIHEARNDFSNNYNSTTCYVRIKINEVILFYF